MADTELKEKATEILQKMLLMMEVQSTIEATEDEEGNPRLQITTEEAGRLIGRSGQTLESIELILNRILRKNDAPEQHTPWVALEVDGYHVSAPKSAHDNKGDHRSGRLPHNEVERLQAMAKDIAREVKKLQMPRVIGPFSPAERRIIHLVLENDPEVETVSDAVADEHRGKKITVQLKNN